MSIYKKIYKKQLDCVLELTSVIDLYILNKLSVTGNVCFSSFDCLFFRVNLTLGVIHKFSSGRNKFIYHSVSNIKEEKVKETEYKWKMYKLKVRKVTISWYTVLFLFFKSHFFIAIEYNMPNSIQKSRVLTTGLLHIHPPSLVAPSRLEAWLVPLCW